MSNRKSPDQLHDEAEVICLVPDRGIRRGALRFYRASEADKILLSGYLVKGMFELGSLVVVYGAPKSGKSFLMLHVAWHVALNKEVLGRRVQSAPVIYCALEGGAGFMRRIKALIDKHRVTPSNFYYVAQSANFFSDDTAIAALIAFAVEVGAKLIVIDTLARALAGGDENTGRDMGKMIERMDRVKEETSACICLVHHTGKDEKKGERGHSSLRGALDVSILVSRDKATGVRQLEVEAHKDGSEGECLRFNLVPVEVGKDADGDPITSMIVEEMASDSLPLWKGKRLTPTEEGWFGDVCEFFNQFPEHEGASGSINDGCSPSPKRMGDRAKLIPFLIKRGRLPSPTVSNTSPRADEKVIEQNRKTTHKWLMNLRDKGKLGVNSTHFWLL